MSDKTEEQLNKSSVRPEPEAVSLPLDDEKHEAVSVTLNELEREKKAREEEARKKNGFRKFLHVIAWPFSAPFRLLKKIRLPLTVKMLIIFAVFFSAILIGYTVYFVRSAAAVAAQTPNGSEYMSSLVATTAIVVSLAVIVFAALTGVVSSWVLNPIRKITRGIDEIRAEDLSRRLEPVDTQDELTELTNRINGMLDHIEETFKRQENFVADASHELKTPISVITGYANMLKRWGAKDESILAEGIDAICRESENMRRMVEQLLLLARIGKINTHVTRFDADAVLCETVEGYRRSNEKQQVITYKGEGEIVVDTDRNLLVELVRILVNNAVKYTPEGGSVTVSVWAEESALKISVADTGRGISAEDLPQLYDRFFRCDRSRGRESGGTGLGLTIAKSIADTLGGEIGVESELGEGTVFTVTIY